MKEKKPILEANPLPIGNTRVIEHTLETYYVIPSPATTYKWAVAGGEIRQGQNTPIIIVQWGKAKTKGYVKVNAVSISPDAGIAITIGIDKTQKSKK